MVEGDANESLLLPEGSRLLHIGPPKTGTSAIQSAARAALPQLREHGVHYPNFGRGHGKAIASFLDIQNLTLTGSEVEPGATPDQALRAPSRAAWSALMADVAREPSRRVLISHEVTSQASDVQAKELIQELGYGVTHVVITLRPLAELLASRWSQNLKYGESRTLEDWLSDLFDELQETPVRLAGPLDHAGLVERWANAAGPENVTVVLVSKEDRGLATAAFESLLRLPGGTLAEAGTDGPLVNRSMSAPEAEAIRRINELSYDAETTSWPMYRHVMWRGGINRLLGSRSPDTTEPRVLLPAWAAERAVTAGTAHAAEIEGSGVRIVGDLKALSAKPGVPQAIPETSAESAADIAVQLMSGALDGASRYESGLLRRIRRTQARADLEVAKRRKVQRRVRRLRRRTIRDQVEAMPAAQRPRSAARSYTTRDLVRALGMRVKHKVRTGKSMKLK